MLLLLLRRRRRLPGTRTHSTWLCGPRRAFVVRAFVITGWACLGMRCGKRSGTRCVHVRDAAPRNNDFSTYAVLCRWLCDHGWLGHSY